MLLNIGHIDLLRKQDRVSGKRWQTKNMFIPTPFLKHTTHINECNIMTKRANIVVPVAKLVTVLAPGQTQWNLDHIGRGRGAARPSFPAPHEVYVSVITHVFSRARGSATGPEAHPAAVANISTGVPSGSFRSKEKNVTRTCCSQGAI